MPNAKVLNMSELSLGSTRRTGLFALRRAAALIDAWAAAEV